MTVTSVSTKVYRGEGGGGGGATPNQNKYSSTCLRAFIMTVTSMSTKVYRGGGAGGQPIERSTPALASEHLS